MMYYKAIQNKQKLATIIKFGEKSTKEPDPSKFWVVKKGKAPPPSQPNQHRH